MKRTLGLLLLLLSLLAAENPLAAEKWTAFRAAPFTVFTNASDKDAQQTLVTLSQLRHTLSEKFGKDLQPVWPIAIVHRKNNAEIGDLRLGRDSYLLPLPPGPVPPQILEQLTLLLLKENTATMDPAIERGVARLFSTLQVDGPRVTLGAPPADKDLDWARMHLLLTDPRWSGSPSKVLLSNFAKGIDGDAAWRNTTGVLQRDFDKEAQSHLAKGAPGTVPLTGRPMDPRRIRGEELEPAEAQTLLADLAGKAAPAGAQALLQQNTKESLEQAWKLNPRWSLPHERLAALETKQSDKAQRFRKAAELSPREVRLWRAAAEAFEAAELPAEAAKMWFAAERAAPTPAERAQLRQVRLASDQKRVEAEEAERRRIQEAEARELQRLKDEAITRIREAEAKANAGAKPSTAKPVEWWDGPRPDATLTGKLLRVDCKPNGAMSLLIGADLKTAKALSVKDPGKIVVTGNGAVDLSCGPQRSPRTVTAEYQKASNEVSTLTFSGAQ